MQYMYLSPKVYQILLVLNNTGYEKIDTNNTENSC